MGLFKHAFTVSDFARDCYIAPVLRQTCASESAAIVIAFPLRTRQHDLERRVRASFGHRVDDRPLTRRLIDWCFGF